MAMRLSELPDGRVSDLVRACIARSARSFDLEGGRMILPALTAAQAPRYRVRAVRKRPGRFVISFLPPKGKEPLVSFEAGSFGGSRGIVLLSDARVSPG